MKKIIKKHLTTGLLATAALAAMLVHAQTPDHQTVPNDIQEWCKAHETWAEIDMRSLQPVNVRDVRQQGKKVENSTDWNAREAYIQYCH